MDIDKYQTLTGLTVSASKTTLVEAQLKRTRVALETMLGYPLLKSKVSTNYYEERGKRQNECGIHDSDETLTDPDDVINSYRLFEYNEKDRFFFTDPFTKLHAVKLVFIEPGDDPNGITFKTFDNDHIRVDKRGEVASYIEKCDDCWCICTQPRHLQLAVDADWVYDACLPSDLLYLWADMVGYYSDDTSNIKSQTLGPHSYTKFDKVAPETESHAVSILRKYAGPNGSLARTITV